MRFSFIGMSNIGKTYWSKRIAAAQGIDYICCDSLIEKQLGPELKALGYRGLRDVAKWMGQPADPQYGENSARYIACEKQAMHDIIDRLRADAKMPAVIDTTGSVIYTGAETLAALRELTRVVYFEASDAHIEDLFRRYIAHPKPLIWGSSYAPQNGEDARQTLKRCYPELLRKRGQRYHELAHVTIPFDRHRERHMDLVGFIGEMGKP